MCGKVRKIKSFLLGFAGCFSQFLLLDKQVSQLRKTCEIFHNVFRSETVNLLIFAKKKTQITLEHLYRSGLNYFSLLLLPDYGYYCSKTNTPCYSLPKGTARIRKDAVHLSRPKYDGLKMSLRDFLDWEREPDGWKYEWNNGIIEINEVSMRNTERNIADNILFAFEQTLFRKQRHALLPETDCLLPSGQVRRPDIAYFTYEQIQASACGEQLVPPFTIELISKIDGVGKVDEKLAEYFASGAHCVWHILPESRRVMVYTSLKDVQICSDEDVCSARPALDFTMKADEIFA